VKPTKLTVRVGRTFNIGNYESLRVDAECEFESVTPIIDRDREWMRDRIDRASQVLLDEVTSNANNLISKIRG